MPRDDTRHQPRAEKPKWRKLQPDLGQMSAEKAIVLALHHLELAHSMFNCIEPEKDLSNPIYEYDDPERDAAENQVRLKYALAALEKRYPERVGNGPLRAGAAAFLQAIIATQDRESREWLENCPVEGDDDKSGNQQKRT